MHIFWYSPKGDGKITCYQIAQVLCFLPTARQGMKFSTRYTQFFFQTQLAYVFMILCTKGQHWAAHGDRRWFQPLGNMRLQVLQGRNFEWFRRADMQSALQQRLLQGSLTQLSRGAFLRLSTVPLFAVSRQTPAKGSGGRVHPPLLA